MNAETLPHAVLPIPGNALKILRPLRQPGQLLGQVIGIAWLEAKSGLAMLEHFGRAADTAARKVDLPAFGMPSSPASAISFSRSQTPSTLQLP